MLTPRLVLVDDTAAIRAGLPVLLPAYDFVASYPAVEDLLAERPAADLVLLDLKLANGSQPEVSQGLAAVVATVHAGYRVCLYSQEERRFVLAACLAAGASGLVAKSVAMPEVTAAVDRVLAGEVVLPPSLVGLAEVLVRRGNLRLLSERQRELLAGRARGKTYAEIAEDLHLAESTLRGYWADLTRTVAAHLRESAPADIEYALGLAPGDLLWPGPAIRTGASHPPRAAPRPRRGPPSGRSTGGWRRTPR